MPAFSHMALWEKEPCSHALLNSLEAHVAVQSPVNSHFLGSNLGGGLWIFHENLPLKLTHIHLGTTAQA